MHYKLSIIGLMSGTSLDGLDIAFVNFEYKSEAIKFEILHSETIPYSKDLTNQLQNSVNSSVTEFLILDKKIGQVFGENINQFITKYKIDKRQIDAIASHGHTTFHQPENGFTSQIGCGTTIAITTGIPVINDFRTKDVILGGQGAPLVPVGDFNLFNQFAESFLNLGGITNISYKKDGKIIAYDICPANLPLNLICKEKLHLTYDPNGENARKGKIIPELLNELNNLNFYKVQYPKSLGTEWLNSDFYPILEEFKESSGIDLLTTIIEHEAIQISSTLNNNNLQSVYISGGGAKNSFLIERIQNSFKGEVIAPNHTIIDFKEAIIFAFLGAQYLQKLPNTVNSVTGAKRDCIGGILHIPD